MNDGTHSADHSLSFSQLERIERIRDAFKAAWKKAVQDDCDPPKLEEFLEGVHQPERSALANELFLIEFDYRSEDGAIRAREEYRKRFPEFVTLLEAIRSGDATANVSVRQDLGSHCPEGTAVSELSPDVDSFGTTLDVANRQQEDTATFHGPSRPASTSLDLPSFSEYDLLEEIGKGGMGVVYRARQKSADRIVALKVVRPERLDGFGEQERRDVIQRFRTEARAAARLDHENIVTVFDVGEDNDRHYYSMRFVDGTNLADLIAKEPLDGQRAARYIELVSRAVHDAHQAGILHRDLKPQNIIVDEKTDCPLVADFGLAKLSQEGRDLTIAGEVFGSPPFMSPEQALDSANVAATSDVYSLGATLYALLTGRPPFQGGSIPQILRRVIEDQPDRPRKLNKGVDRDLETICLKALAKDPTDRYPSAEALADDLERYRSGKTIQARPAPLVRKAWRTVRRRPLQSIAVAATLLVIAAAALTFSLSSENRELASLFHKIDVKLDEGAWSEKKLVEIEQLIVQLEALDKEGAKAARQQLLRRFAESIDADIHAGTLEPTDVERLEQTIALLAVRDRRAADELSKKLDARMRTWVDVLKLSAPFRNLENIFEAHRVVVEGGTLLSNPGSTSGRRIFTKTKTRGNVEMEAVFLAQSWSETRRLGISVSSNSEQGYDFLVVASPKTVRFDQRPGTPNLTLGAIAESGSVAHLLIVKNGIAVRSQPIRLKPGPLRLLARREENRLFFQVNAHSAVEFQDIFPLDESLPRSLAVIWPGGVRLEMLRVATLSLPSLPSPLEEGDYSFRNGEYSSSLEEYRTQDNYATRDDIRQEAQFKQALCLIELNRRDEAAVILDQVAGREGEPWPLLAACHLWKLRLEEKKWDDADFVFQVHIANRHRFEQLALYLPEDVRKSMLHTYQDRARGANVVNFDENDRRQIERAHRTTELLTGEAPFSPALVRSYRASGQTNEASKLAARMLKHSQFLQAEIRLRIWLVEEYAWLLRLQGTPKDALKLVNDMLASHPGSRDDSEYWPLLIEKARTHAALNEWDEAERAIENYFTQVTAGNALYKHHSAACLLRGFLRDRRGNRTGAVESWREGLYQRWRGERTKMLPEGRSAPPRVPSAHYDQFSGMEMVQFIILCGLTGELSGDEAEAIVKWLAFRQGEDSVLKSFTGAFSIFSSDKFARPFRHLCDTGRGMLTAQQITFQSINFRQFTTYPMFILAYELAHQGALPKLTGEQDEFLWHLIEDCFESYRAGELSKVQLIQMFIAWERGVQGSQWLRIADSLPPNVRWRLAYTFAHRLVRLKQVEQATEIFQAVLENTSSESPLHQLLIADLDRLEAEGVTVTR